MNSITSFIDGWLYGRVHKVELTDRQIQSQFPNVDPQAFAQGNIDGIKNDEFRLARSKEQLEQLKERRMS